MNNMGVMILAGSDFAGMPYVYPGISLHQELKLLVETGLSNYEALKTATINPAIFMAKQSHYGSVSIGKYADMIILEKNPLANIENIKAIKFVILKGEIYDHEK
jgi:imidazolonepropionase-like amidohydrolase